MIQIHKSLTFVGDCASQLLLASPVKSMVIMVVVSVVLGVHWDAGTGQKVCRLSWWVNVAVFKEHLQTVIEY